LSDPVERALDMVREAAGRRERFDPATALLEEASKARPLTSCATPNDNGGEARHEAAGGRVAAGIEGPQSAFAARSGVEYERAHDPKA
jgi:hypothetical protein